MKAILLTLVFILSMTSAFAQNAADCFAKATSVLSGPGMSVDSSIALCSGAENLEPVSCLQKSTSMLSGLGLSVDSGIVLCAGTNNTEKTISCFRKAVSMISGHGLSIDSAIKLCKSK